MASSRDDPAFYGMSQEPQTQVPMETAQTPRPGRTLSFDSLIVSPVEESDEHSLQQPSSTNTLHPPSTPPHSQNDKLLDATSNNFPSIFQIWWPEFLTCLLILGMFGAVVGTISPYQDRPLPNWPFRLQINTVVSIYFTVIKASLIFVLAEGLGQLKWGWFSNSDSRPLYHLAAYDNATRGPWGSLNFLWKLRCRAFFPSVAALTIVLATIVDPFGQQIIRFYPCPIPAHGENIQSATIPRTRFVDGGAPGGNIDPIEATVFNGFTLSGDMQDAILGGIYSSHKSSERPIPPDPVQFECPSGNCTFSDPYISAGWCSKCTDLTPEIRVIQVPEKNYTIPGPLGDYYFIVYDHKNATLVYSAPFVNSDPPYPPPDPSSESASDTPFGPTFGKRQTSEDSPPPSPPDTSFEDSDDTTFDGSDDTPGAGDTVKNLTTARLSASLTDPPILILSSLHSMGAGQSPSSIVVALLGSDGPRDLGQESTTYFAPDSFIRNSNPRGAGAAACSLSPCVRKYTANVTNGILAETILAESSDWGSAPMATYLPPCWSILDVSCLNTTEKSELRAANYTFSDSDHFLKYHFSGWTFPDTDWDYGSTGWSDALAVDRKDVFVRPQCIYQAYRPTVGSVQSYLSYLFGDPMNLDNTYTWVGKTPFFAVGASSGWIQVDGPSHLQSIYQNGNVSLQSLERIFEGMANSMTLLSRRPGRQYVEEVKGKVWTQDTCVDVRWWWIVYPAVLAVLTIGFLIGAVLDGRGMFGRKGRGMTSGGGSITRQGYKNGVLPLVLFGVERKNMGESEGGETMVEVAGQGQSPRTQIKRNFITRIQDIGSVEAGEGGGGSGHGTYGDSVVERIEDIESLSKKMRVRLDKTEGEGWRFREV